jgi:NAD(P)-dependent dehydrogenase (short-subunit alcohol dehydrogenase family)
MKIDLSGKTAIVTGSTAGIGYAIAKGLAQAGADVVVNGRTAAAVESALAKLSSEVAQANIRGVAADVGSADGCSALVAAQPSVDISSDSALDIPANMIHYGFTKTAVLSISRGLAKRTAGTGVTVNAILPGPTLSEGLESMLKEEQKASVLSMEETATAFVMKHRPSSIIQRAATVEEVANMVVYAASLQASATTGAALRVDGGVIETIT